MGRIGILGAGQLGKMLNAAASKSHVPLHYLDTSKDMPANYGAASMTIGDIRSHEDVVRFGADKEVVSIEIEAVSTSGLRALADQGTRILPHPDALSTIQDKGLQKQFYHRAGLPTSAFHLYDTKADIWRGILDGAIRYPFVQKARRDGYDGKGVVVVNDENDLPDLLDTPSVVEEKVDIDREVAAVFARSRDRIVMMPPVEMVFDPKLNLISHLQCPTLLSEDQHAAIRSYGEGILRGLSLEGMLAVEYFIDRDGQVLVNEVAPRPHNSGHHSIEACSHSQYDLMLRCLLDQPLPDVHLRTPAMMINLVGAEGHEGPPTIEGLDYLLAHSEAHLHWYGKALTRPGRKMGHITLIHEDVHHLHHLVEQIHDRIHIIST